MIQVDEMFSTPIFHFRASNHEEIKTYIKKDIYPEFEKIGYNSKHCNVFSDYFPGAPKLDQTKLSNLYQEDMFQLLEFVGFDRNKKWDIYPAFWYNITGKGGWQEQHDHISGPLPSQFSGIHYVQFDENEHQAAEFESPVCSLMRSMMPCENKDNAPDFFRHLSAVPKTIKEGDIIVFPSYLKHAVNIQESEKERISIAFNMGIWSHEFININ